MIQEKKWQNIAICDNSIKLGNIILNEKQVLKV